MKHGKPSWLGAIVVTSFLGTASAMAATTYDTMGKLPPELTQGNVTYISGGIGRDQAAAMRKEEHEFPLSLEFVKREKSANEHVAGVDVTIKDPQGRTDLHTLADGPYLLARLPDGKYKVTAEFEGKSRTRDVMIAAHKPERIVFQW